LTSTNGCPEVVLLNRYYPFGKSIIELKFSGSAARPWNGDYKLARHPGRSEGSSSHRSTRQRMLRCAQHDVRGAATVVPVIPGRAAELGICGFGPPTSPTLGEVAERSEAGGVASATTRTSPAPIAIGATPPRVGGVRHPPLRGRGGQGGEEQRSYRATLPPRRTKGPPHHPTPHLCPSRLAVRSTLGASSPAAPAVRASPWDRRCRTNPLRNGPFPTPPGRPATYPLRPDVVPPPLRGASAVLPRQRSGAGGNAIGCERRPAPTAFTR